MKQNPKQQNEYRLVIFKESTFEEIRGFKFKIIYLYVGVVVFFLTLACIFLFLISMKPVQRFMARQYVEINSEEILNLRRQIIGMEDETRAQQVYIQNLRHLLSGEPILDQDSAIFSPITEVSNKIPRIEEDELLRNEIDLNEKLTISTPIRPTENQQGKAIELMYLIPPVSGEISLSFNLERNHHGLDISAPKNTPVKAILHGYIIYAGWTLETGNTIGIQHENNLISFYKHNSELLKTTGSFVNAGEAIAIIGNTGTLSSGPHLHFELWLNGKPVDPEKYINFN